MRKEKTITLSALWNTCHRNWGGYYISHLSVLHLGNPVSVAPHVYTFWLAQPKPKHTHTKKLQSIVLQYAISGRPILQINSHKCFFFLKIEFFFVFSLAWKRNRMFPILSRNMLHPSTHTTQQNCGKWEKAYICTEASTFPLCWFRATSSFVIVQLTKWMYAMHMTYVINFSFRTGRRQLFLMQNANCVIY